MTVCFQQHIASLASVVIVTKALALQIRVAVATAAVLVIEMRNSCDDYFILLPYGGLVERSKMLSKSILVVYVEFSLLRLVRKEGFEAEWVQEKKQAVGRR